MAVPALHCTKPLESYDIFQLRSKEMSSADQVTEFRQQEFTANLCLHEFFCIVFCSFLLPLPQLQQSVRVSCDDHEMISPLPDVKSATCRQDLPNRRHYIPNTICPPCYVSFLTGNKRKLMRKHDNKCKSPNNRPQHLR